MKTDKQIFKIFQAQPQWVYLLAEEPSPGPCRFESKTFKEIEKRTDGLLVPDSPDRKIAIVEIQGYEDSFLYQRVVIEMAMVQQEYVGRGVQGIILLLDDTTDPKTEPWRKVVRTISLRRAMSKIRKQQPKHPLVAVFAPLLAKTDAILERDAAPCYNLLQESALPKPVRETLVDVYVNWLEQRLCNKGKKEIEEMLLGQLPDLRETQSGKDLIAIGKVEGKLEGKLEGLVKLLEVRFGKISTVLKMKLSKIESDEQLDRLYEHALAISKLADFKVKDPK